MKLLLVVYCMICGSYVNACLNFFLLDERGNPHGYSGPDNPTNIYVKADIAKKVHELQEAIPHATEERRFFLIADYAAMLVKAGCSEEAVPVLQHLLKDHPDEYNLYANLAVAYELLGQPDTALVYLKTSMKLNPSSHEKSEWAHKQILEYVVNQKGNNSDFSAGKVLNIKETPDEYTNENTGDQIVYQLRERIPLTPAPNELLSRVIEETAIFYRRNISLEWALQFYAISIAYVSDETRKQALWKEVNALMPKLFALHAKNDVKFQKFSKDKWQQQFDEIISKWKNYRPYQYDGPVIDITY